MRVFLALLALVLVASAQSPAIPRNLTFAFGSEDPDFVVEAFLDFQCPDSKAAWPTLVDLVRKDHRVQVVLRLFPLPYHRASFDAAWAFLLVHRLAGIHQGKDVWMGYASALFDNQDQFGTAATAKLNEYEVQSLLASFASKWVSKHEVLHLWDSKASTDYNLDVRRLWKNGASRGVYGTPFFAVNTAVVSDPQPTWTVGQWETFLNSLE